MSETKGIITLKPPRERERERGVSVVSVCECESMSVSAIAEPSPCVFGFVQPFYLSQVECIGLAKSLQKVVSKTF